ncbi:transglycosylase SLT domain-containing protein [Colwellia piezophila]|uniref:transglycosylase SLT domain-containing protein n=1 Tax=Colwellia piezophila TaxID=211668 RepID=UPI00047686A3|nr:transglycosylase SLT domain-containing protein [Colwellia piezophila]
MKNILKILLYSVCSLASLNMSQASENLKIKTDIGQQNIFLKAERLLAQSYSQQYKSLYNQLYYYPLQPYLDQRRLIETIQLSSAGEISTFLAKYRNSPLDWPLRKPWLKYLAKKNKGTLFLEFYKATSNTVLICQNLTFSLMAGIPQSEVLPQVTKLWLVGKSLDKACDPIINQWQQAGYRTDKLVWQRIALAADGGKHTLIPYLTKLLPKEQQYLGKLWHQVRRDPAVVVRLKKFINKSVKESQIYSYGIKRLIWRDPNRALASYKNAQKTFTFTVEQTKKITEKFAIALASKNHPQARTWLNKLDLENVDSSILQWQLAEALKQQNWQLVLRELANMPVEYKTQLQWQYWYARALIATNELEQGQYVMNELANKRHYYGFLAASYLERPVSLQDSPLTVTTQEKYSILLHPSAKRAFEFYYLGRYVEARREWRYWLSMLSKREKLVAAKLANENGWFDRAIFTLAQVGYLDDVELRFPKAFDKKINRHAQKQSINPAWAFAIARRESSFMTDARSSVGAKGLMQLMPNTAKQLTRGSVSRQYLYNAENNIQLGTKYLRKLLDKSKGNQVIATASYNAGPYRVKRWLKNNSTMPADIWIETIPFKETRNYVKSVLAYQEIYQHKPGQVSQVFEQVLNMNIGD